MLVWLSLLGRCDECGFAAELNLFRSTTLIGANALGFELYMVSLATFAASSVSKAIWTFLENVSSLLCPLNRAFMTVSLFTEHTKRVQSASSSGLTVSGRILAAKSRIDSPGFLFKSL